MIGLDLAKNKFQAHGENVDVSVANPTDLAAKLARWPVTASGVRELVTEAQKQAS